MRDARQSGDGVQTMHVECAVQLMYTSGYGYAYTPESTHLRVYISKCTPGSDSYENGDSDHRLHMVLFDARKNKVS